MEKVKQSGIKINAIKICKGSIFSIIISGVSLIIFASILTSTDIKESTIPSVVIIISLISILIGSSISSRKIKRKGIVNGAIVGTIYISIIYILSSILITGFSLNLYSTIMIVGAIIAGMIGGIVGVNIK